MDTMTPAQRSRCMAAIKSEGTSLERAVAKAVRALGLKCRLNRKGLPGTPDITIPGRRTAVFAHGCFWHRHRCKAGQRQPGTNAAFWREKFERNVRRDRRAARALRKDGWRVITVWECRTKDHDALVRRLGRVLSNKEPRKELNT